ncbi:MAG: ribbon-helix-helix protein, CopG family [Thermoplasmatales archaeon]|nr:ribbon-helix-helix protein, CopG family [Thermoplasmatales archaeon]
MSSPSSGRVSIRLSKETLAVLQSLVEDGEFENLSDVLRKAVDEFIEARFTPENILKITVDLPKGNVNDLQHLIDEGDSVSLDDAIRNAVREYTRNRIKKQEDQ